LANVVDGFDREAFSRLSQLEEGHFWFVARNALIVGLVSRFFPNARSFLEIGCGNGNVIRAVAAVRAWSRLTGSDLHPAGLAIARKRLGTTIELVQADAQRMHMANVFDVVGAFDVLEHIHDDESVLRTIRLACRTGGGVILAVPQHPSLWSPADEAAHHVRRYQRGELEKKLVGNGFEVLFTSSFNFVLFPLMAASRLYSRLRREPADLSIEREGRISAPVNSVLSALLGGEVRLTLAGIRWPIGGSRVIVARPI
jgi:SAM-dependent methyltransferase